MVNLMIVKVRGNNRAFHIVCGVLYRGKGIDVLSMRKHHNASGMLPCGSSDSGQTLHKAVNLCISLLLSSFFVVILNHAVGGLFGERTDGPGLKGIFLTENRSGVGMRFRLVLSREV